MRKDTYRIGDGTFAFSPAVFDSLLGHGAKGAARMRELAGAMHVSISSIKDWRRGTHAPSDFEKVEDIACWAHIDVADLLIESGDRTMDEKLTENQLDVLCVLWNQAYDFLDLCEETDHFAWPTTDLRCVPDSILHDIKVNPEDDKSRPPWEIGTEDLFLQTLDAYLRACRRATPYVGESDIFVRLLGLCDIMTETAFGEDDGKWLPDPDMIFEREVEQAVWGRPVRIWEDYMETIFVTESREMLFTGTEDIDVRPLNSSELHYEGDSREEALRAAHKVSAASRVGVCQRGFARFVATVSEITLDGEGFTEHMDTVHTVDPLDRMPELRTLAREAAANRADGKIIRHIAGHTEAIDAAKRAGDYYSLYRVEGSAFGDFSCYRVGHAPYNGTLYLPAGFHDYGIATVDELFVALAVGRCEFLCEYQDEIDEVYHGLFEKRI